MKLGPRAPFSLLLLCVALLGVFARQAAGQTPATADDQKKAEARLHFERGVELNKQQAWEPALAEFLRSRELYPTKGNTQNAALALAKLGRFHEALDMMETLLREFRDIPPNEKTLIESEITKLRERVGTIEIVYPQAGATVAIDGVTRGTTPLSGALRVSSGTHLVRVFRPGALPFEARVEVAGGQNARVTPVLTALQTSGRLKIVEQTGQSAEVLIDGVVVGRTPWEGDLVVGSHAVTLRGAGNLGTAPANAPVNAGTTTALTLALEPLECELRVEPIPVNARIAIDGVEVGRGNWQSRLRCGSHRIEAGAEGFLSEQQSISLSARRPGSLRIELDRDPDSPLWAGDTPSHIFLELELGPALAFGFGGDVAESCTDSCARSTPFGFLALFHGGYQLRSGLSASLDVGYIRLGMNAKGREASAKTVPDGRPLDATLDDELVLRGFLAGISGAYRTGTDWVWTFRLSLGALVGTLDDTRSATLVDGADSGDYPKSTDSLGARYAYASPEIAFGPRFGRFDLALGVRPMLFVAISKLDASTEQRVANGPIGFFRFDEEALGSSTFGVVSATLSARYGFY